MIPTFKLQARYIAATASIIFVMSALQFFLQQRLYESNTQTLTTQLAHNTEQSLTNQLQLRGMSLARFLTESLFDPMYANNLDAVYRLLLPVLSQHEVRKINVVDNKGLIFHDGSKTLESFGLRHPNPKAMSTALKQQGTYISRSNNLLRIAMPIQQENVVLGAVYIEMCLDNLKDDISSNQRLLEQIKYAENQQLQITHGVVTLISFVIGVLLSYWVGRSLTRPIRQLIQHISLTGDGRFESIEHNRREDEIGELVHAFNIMGEKINRRTEDIKFMAFHDSLTHLPNRALFVKHVSEQILSPETSSLLVCFIDLDEFKQVNDTFGHEAGDTLLVEIGRRLKNALVSPELCLFNEEDTCMVGRVGGDEFLICIPNISRHGAHKVAHHLLKLLNEPIKIEKESVIVGSSIGFATYPECGNTAQQLIKSADIAMYDAKSKGKNTFSFFNQEMNNKLIERTDIERELRRSLADLSQFELYYQPKVDITNNTLIGAEALIRWNHPERGLISPDRFIPIAEDSLMILEIGQHIIETATKQLHDWQALLPENFHIAINLSAKQICRQDLVGIFSKQIEKYNLSAKQLHVEVTEHQLMYDVNKASRVLNNLGKLGIEVWLDDFGTGYSSLSYLREFSFDGVKIERSFIVDNAHNDFDKPLVNGIVSLANSLNIGTVAEGVETKEQVEFIHEIGCRAAQGYLFDKPLPSQRFLSQWLNNSNGCPFNKTQQEVDELRLPNCEIFSAP